MKNIFRRFFAVLLCFLLCYSFLSAQNSENSDIVKSNTEIERELTIPQRSASEADSVSSSGNKESTAWQLIKMVLVLALICFLIWFAGKFIKKKMDPGAEPDLYLKKTAQLTLAPGRTVQVVTFRNRAYVLGVSEGGISVIDEIDSKDTEDKELIDDMNLHASENLNAKPQDFASMISSLSNSSKRTENFIKNRRLNFRNNGEKK